MRKFNLNRALANWQFLYPDPLELESVLRLELASCHGTVRDRRGHLVTREYPKTERNLTLMLLALEGNPDA